MEEITSDEVNQEISKWYWSDECRRDEGDEETVLSYCAYLLKRIRELEKGKRHMSPSEALQIFKSAVDSGAI